MLRFLAKTLLLLLLLVSNTAYAFVAVTNTTINSVATNDVTISHNHTGNFLVVSIAQRYGAECLSGSTAVKYKGVNLTRTIATVANTGVYLYHIATSSSGSGNLVVDFCSPSVGRENRVVVYSLSGVNTSSPIGDTAFKNVGSGVYVNNLDATSTSAGSYFFNVKSAINTLTKTGDQTSVSVGQSSSFNYGHAKLYASSSATVYDFDWSWTSGAGDGNGQVVAEYLTAEAPPVDNASTTIYFSYDNLLSMNGVIGQTCETVGATTTCEFAFSTTTTSILVNSQDIIFALAVIVFLLAFMWFAYMLGPFKTKKI